MDYVQGTVLGHKRAKFGPCISPPSVHTSVNILSFVGPDGTSWLPTFPALVSMRCFFFLHAADSWFLSSIESLLSLVSVPQDPTLRKQSNKLSPAGVLMSDIAPS